MSQNNKEIMNINVIYEKVNQELNIYKIELVNHREDQEAIKEIQEINEQIRISTELYIIYKKSINEFEYNELSGDSKYLEIKNKLDKEKEDEIKEFTSQLNNKLLIEESKRICLENNLKEKIIIETDRIKNDSQIEINNLKNEIELYKMKLSDEKKYAEDNKMKMSELYNSMISKIDNIDKYFNKNTPSSVSGEIGESFIFDYISSNLELTNGIIKRVNGKSNACDMYLQYNYLNCCIESKNHAAPISQAQIKRFLTTDLKNPNYNSGIFISIKSDYAEINNLKHFDIRMEDNKPCIFLSNFIMRPNDIILAIKILDYIIYNNKCNTSDINTFISMLNSNLDMMNTLIDINLDNIKNLNKSNQLIKNKQNEIEDLLDIPKKNIVEYKCEKCDKIYKSQTNLTKHLLNCKIQK